MQWHGSTPNTTYRCHHSQLIGRQELGCLRQVRCKTRSEKKLITDMNFTVFESADSSVTEALKYYTRCLATRPPRCSLIGQNNRYICNCRRLGQPQGAQHDFVKIFALKNVCCYQPYKTTTQNTYDSTGFQCSQGNVKRYLPGKPAIIGVLTQSGLIHRTRIPCSLSSLWLL